MQQTCNQMMLRAKLAPAQLPLGTGSAKLAKFCVVPYAPAAAGFDCGDVCQPLWLAVFFLSN
jgi:hypothetical protein